MRRSSPSSTLALALAAGAAMVEAAPPPPKAPAPAAPGFARLTYVDRRVDQGMGSAALTAATENSPLRFGETLRTGPEGMVRLEFPWMSLTVSPSSVVSFPNDLVLSTRLEQGRVLLQSGHREILKLITQEAEIRGAGRAIVRRENDTTLVTCVDGRFVVEAAGRAVVATVARGVVVRAGQAPQGPFELPPSPSGLWPASDPVYVTAGNPVALRWEPRGSAYSVEVLAVGDDVVLIQRDAASASLGLPIAWPGAFRFRVAARDARGLEGLPSGDGLIVVDDK
jgi:hypothetical protein